MVCTLCEKEDEFFRKVNGWGNQKLWLCSQCKLLFRSSAEFVSQSKEKERYLTHNNSLEDEGYVSFLLRAYKVAKGNLHSGAKILDYGCGYNPVFAKLMKKRGWECDHFDPLFYPEGIRQSQYKNIFCIETAEHFNYPLQDWDKLNRLLAENGTLTVMTDLWSDEESLADWHYLNDKTHVSFYHQTTFQWIADKFDWELLGIHQNRISIFKKKAAAQN
jgi:hypothetical protein